MSRLLLVEDDEGNRVTLAALLEDEGFTVDCATSRAEALSILEQAVTPYDAVLLDYALGDGDGSDLIPVIRRLFPGAKVVAMSASVPAELTFGPDASLPKGAYFPDFLAALRALLGA